MIGERECDERLQFAGGSVVVGGLHRRSVTAAARISHFVRHCSVLSTAKARSPVLGFAYRRRITTLEKRCKIDSWVVGYTCNINF